MDQIKLYNILRTDLELTDDRAADFVSALGKTAERELDARMQTLATKNDIHLLSERIYSQDKTIYSLDVKIEQFKSDIYKAIFLSGIVQYIAIIASVLAIIKFIK